MLDVVILVPEITKGMKSVGAKALLKIKDSLSILEYQIQQLKKYRKNNIHIIGGFEIEKIHKALSKYKVNIIYNEQYLITNQAKGIKLFLDNNNCKNLFIVSNGILFKNNPFDCVSDGHSKVFLIDKPKSNFNIGCADTDSDDVNYLFYDLPLAWSECSFFNKEAIDKFMELYEQQNLDQMYLFEIINMLVSNNIKFNKRTIAKKNIMKINSITDLSKAKIFI